MLHFFLFSCMAMSFPFVPAIRKNNPAYANEKGNILLLRRRIKAASSAYFKRWPDSFEPSGLENTPPIVRLSFFAFVELAGKPMDILVVENRIKSRI
ncbi:hypothetical protein QJ48_07525 [Paenibacillus sp. A3]|nr:hypothetical protein QJ48_07525 [Paenibacillus sp. A3]